jgi:thiaminase (transcriptional activator TenA)
MGRRNLSFTESLWQDISPIYGAILAHPFIHELATGDLARERFVFYMQQDSLYLQDFSRALAIAGARLPNAQDMESYLGFASGALTVERALHEIYFREFGVDAVATKSPACFAYTHYLLSTAALGTSAEALAALLPCFWIYREVGNHVVTQATDNLAKNPYARWIETYAGPDFSSSVDRAIAVTESVAQAESEAERARMRSAFELSSRLEWRFWDSAYRLETWQP